mmetsp:Transcript_25853/g.29809  ORF Transcript_25853/g.29809 Transcript_25853/m.29809 type:complete len:98 (+) Transcript_25853:843-1136(+)
MSHVLGHEGENSLLSYLIQEDLATGLVSYFDHQLSALTYFSFMIFLTDKGLEQYERVIEISMKMVQQLKQEGPLDHVYHECSRNSELRWQYLEKSDG